MLDSGHSGRSGVWLSRDPVVLKTVAEYVPHIRVHVTPYQMNDPGRTFIRKEKRRFVDLIKSHGGNISEKLYFEDKPHGGLPIHFQLLEHFKSAKVT